MKKGMEFISAVILAAMVCAGCGMKSDIQRVSTDGSTSVEKVIGFLSEAYMENNSKVKITYNPTGSGAGIQAVLDGRCDIGISSRELKGNENENLNAAVVAVDGIAMIVNQQNSVEDLTIEQIRKIYTGEIVNWSEVGGHSGAIVLIGREAASGTREGFELITDTKDKCRYTQELTSSGDVIQTVAGNPNAIGYASLASVKDTVKIIKVQGVIPSKATIQNGDYKIQRNFLLITPKNKELKTEAKSFLEFATSKNADRFVEMAGAIPVAR